MKAGVQNLPIFALCNISMVPKKHAHMRFVFNAIFRQTLPHSSYIKMQIPAQLNLFQDMCQNTFCFLFIYIRQYLCN